MEISVCVCVLQLSRLCIIKDKLNRRIIIYLLNDKHKREQVPHAGQNGL